MPNFSRADGSSLSATRVQTDKKLIYANFQVQLPAVQLAVVLRMNQKMLLTKFLAHTQTAK